MHIEQVFFILYGYVFAIPYDGAQLTQDLLSLYGFPAIAMISYDPKASIRIAFQNPVQDIPLFSSCSLTKRTASSACSSFASQAVMIIISLSCRRSGIMELPLLVNTSLPLLLNSSSKVILYLLSFYKLCKKSLLLDQLFIGAVLDDLALIQNQDTVTVTDR